MTCPLFRCLQTAKPRLRRIRKGVDRRPIRTTQRGGDERGAPFVAVATVADLALAGEVVIHLGVQRALRQRLLQCILIVAQQASPCGPR